MSDDFSLIEKEFVAEHWAWEVEFDREMSKRSVYSGGSAESMDLSSRRAELFRCRAIALKSKWLSRIPTPYFEEPSPLTEEELEEWRKIEEEEQNEDCEEDQLEAQMLYLRRSLFISFSGLKKVLGAASEILVYAE